LIDAGTVPAYRVSSLLQQLFLFAWLILLVGSGILRGRWGMGLNWSFALSDFDSRWRSLAGL